MKYEKPELEVVEIKDQDIITDSTSEPDPDYEDKW